MRVLATLFATVVLSACAPTTTTSVVAVDPRITDDVRGADPVPASEATRLFNDVCSGSLPNFASAPRRMSAAGFTVAASTGTRFHATYDASVRVVDGPGLGQTCSMVFVIPGSTSAVDRAFQSALGPITNSPLGRAIPHPNGRTIILVADPRRAGGETYYNLRMLSER